MKITALHLPSFRSFQGVETVPTNQPRVYIAGVEGAGKTTLSREVIRWVLTGKAQGLDGKGAGVDRLVPTMNGSTGVQAGVTIEGLGLVERLWSPTGATLRVQGFTGNSSDQQAALYARLKTTEPFIHAAIDTYHFLNLHHAEAKAMVLDLLNVRIAIGDDPNAPVYSLEELDEVYKAAFEDRKLAKKRLNTFVVPAPPVEPSFSSIPEIDALLAKRRGELEELVAAGGSVSGQRNALLDRKTTLVRQQNFSGAVTADVSDQIADLEERLAIMEADVSTAQAQYVDVSSEIEGSAARIQILRNRAEALATHKPADGCVLDPEVPCETAKLRFNKRAKALKAEIDSLPVPIEPLPPAVSPITAMRQQLTTLNGQQARYEQAKDAHEKRQAELKQIDAELSGLEDTTDRDAKIVEWREKIKKGEQYRLDADRFWKAAEAHQKALTGAQTLREEVDRLEQLCEVLGPSGARVEALQQRLGEFDGSINAFTAPFGWTVKFLLDPWDVTVNGRSLETYSKSERYRVGVAIQMAVAHLSRLNFAVIDELDILLDASRNILQQMIMAAPLEQILIAASREPNRALPPTTPGLVSYRLARTEQGSVVVEQA